MRYRGLGVSGLLPPSGRTLGCGLLVLLLLLGSFGGIGSAHRPGGGGSVLTTASLRSFRTIPPHATATTINGVDVSHHQGTINWASVAGSGVTFAFAKATQGTTFTDPEFAANMANGSAAGVRMAGYDYACPVTDSNTGCTADTGTQEANYFDSVAGPYFKSGYMYPALDFEEGCGVISNAALDGYIIAWMNTVESYISTNDGFTIVPIIYMDSSYASSCVDTNVTQYHLWIANYGVSSPSTGVWSSWNYWQYSSTGTVPGISGSGNVDLDYFNGNLSQLVSGFTFNSTSGTPLTSGYAAKDLTSGATLPCGSSFPLADQIQFTGTASGGSGGYTYAWNFGDGTQGAGNPATHTYTAAGTVNPLLTVTDSAGATNVSGQACQFTATSGLSLSAPLGATPDPVSAGSTTTLSVTVAGGSPPYSYAYSGLPVGCSTANSPSLLCTPTSSGQYSVTVSVTDAAGHNLTSTASLTVNPALSSVTISPASTSIPVSGTANFTAVPTCVGGSCPASGVTYSWSLNNSLGTLSSLTSPTVTFVANAAPGSVTLTVLAHLNGSSQTGTASLTLTSTTSVLSSVSVSPATPTVATGSTTLFTPTPICSPGTCPSSGITYLWKVNNSLGNLSTTLGPTTSFVAGKSPGQVLLTVTATWNGKNVTGTSRITLSSTTPALSSVGISPPSDSLSTGQSAVFDALPVCPAGTCPSNVTYSWSVSNNLGTLLTATGPSTTFVAGNLAGTTTLTVVARLGSASTSGTSTVTISAAGPTALTLVGVTPSSSVVDVGNNAAFNATAHCSPSPCPPGVSYAWWLSNTSFGSLSSSTGGSVSFRAANIPGSVTLFVNATLNGSTVEGFVSITIHSASSPGILGLSDTDYLLLALVAGIVAIAVVAVLVRSRRKRAEMPPEDPNYYFNNGAN